MFIRTVRKIETVVTNTKPRSDSLSTDDKHGGARRTLRICHPGISELYAGCNDWAVDIWTVDIDTPGNMKIPNSRI